MTRWAAVGVVLGWGLVAGWWTPRGPGTPVEALVSIGVSLAAAFAATLARVLTETAG
jgi:hypothetical protein